MQPVLDFSSRSKKQKEFQKLGTKRAFGFKDIFFQLAYDLWRRRDPVRCRMESPRAIWRRFALHPVTSGSREVRAKGGNYHFHGELTTSCNPCLLSLLSASFIYAAISIPTPINVVASCREHRGLGMMTDTLLISLTLEPSSPPCPPFPTPSMMNFCHPTST